MDTQNLSLLAQLISKLREDMAVFEASYKTQDKENFESAKEGILDAQKKINLILQK